MSNTAGATLRGYGKGFGVAAGVLVAAIVGHTAASAAGLQSDSVYVIEGFAGGAVMAAWFGWVFRGLMDTDSDSIRDWDVMNTEVPDVIERNDYMTVVSNPDNGSGVFVWDKETGVEIGVFDSQDTRDSVWLTSDEELEQVGDIIQDKLGEEQ